MRCGGFGAATSTLRPPVEASRPVDGRSDDREEGRRASFNRSRTAAASSARGGDAFHRGAVRSSAAGQVFDLEHRIEVLTAVMRLFLVLIRVMDSRLDRRRLPDGDDKAAILRALERTSRTLSLRSSLQIIRLSSSRYHAWKRAEPRCLLDDVPTCPRSQPSRLTAVEMATMKEMAASPDFWHVPTTTLARLAQRMGKVFASATTWSRLIRERRWRRPRARVHPARPEEGLRTTKPDEAWHVDTTVFRLLDGTKPMYRRSSTTTRGGFSPGESAGSSNLPRRPPCS